MPENGIEKVTTQPSGSGGVQKMVKPFFEHPPSRELNRYENTSIHKFYG